MRMLRTYRKCCPLLTIGVVSSQSLAGSFHSHSPFQVCLLGSVLRFLPIDGRIVPEIVHGVFPELVE